MRAEPWEPGDIDRLTAAAIDAELSDPQRRRLLLGALPHPVAANLPQNDRPADQLRADLTALAALDPAHRRAWLARAEEITRPTHPAAAHLFARYAIGRHALLAGAAGHPAPTWVKTALIHAEQIVRRGLGRAHAAERVARFDAADGGTVLDHLGHFVGGPPVELLWLHLVGELVVERRKLRLRTADGQGLRLDELAEELAAVDAATRVLIIEVAPDTDPAALDRARALDWGPLTLRAIGPDATAQLAAALDAGASTAGALGDALDGASAAPETVLAATGAASVGDAAALGAVVEYLEALRTRCREMPLRQRDARIGETEHIYVPLYTTSPHDADRADPRRGQRALLERDDRPPPTVHDRVAERRCVFAVGEPGSGKTTTLRRLCAALCEAHLAADDAPRADWMPDQPLPVWLDLRDLPAPAADRRRRPADLLDFAYAHLDRCDGRGRLDPTVADRALEDGRLILVLDGLDEVPDPAHRRVWADAITALATTRARKARVWVSCREAARAAGAEPGAPFVRVDLQPFDHEQRRRVVAGWLRARVDAEPAVGEEADALLADLRRHPDVARQAGSPLILAMICHLYFRGRGLPDSRVELYGELINLFLTDRARDADPAIAAIEPHHRRMVLTDLAWTWWIESAAARAGDDRTTGLLHDRCVAIVAAGLAARLKEHTEAACHRLAGALVAFYDQRAGLLRWAGVDPATSERRFDFAHRTFAEYLVACRLSEREDLRRKHQSERHARDANWREVWAMFTALVGRAETGDRGPAWRWVETLAGWAADADRPAEHRARYARLAAECLAPCRDRPPPAETIEAVDGLQATLLDTERCAGFPAEQRVGFWQAVGPHNRLVAGPTALDRWVHIPPGRFWRGAAEDDEMTYPDEQPAGWVELSAYAIQRWPVLVMEYAAFVDVGYGDPSGGRPPWWSAAGWAWRCEHGVTRPGDWFEQRQGRPTHPVIGVSYWEAEAYAGWLGETEEAPSGGAVSLPSEAQWARAARGEGPGSARRRYPWGWDDDRDRRNGEGQHRGTTPIGVFPGGCSVDGCWSMSGNVLEWCLDGFDDGIPRYAKRPSPNPLYLPPSDSAWRVLRGGAWLNGPRRLRLSFRLGVLPADRSGGVGFRCVWRGAPRSRDIPGTRANTVAPAELADTGVASP